MVSSALSAVMWASIQNVLVSKSVPKNLNTVHNFTKTFYLSVYFVPLHMYECLFFRHVFYLNSCMLNLLHINPVLLYVKTSGLLWEWQSKTLKIVIFQNVFLNNLLFGSYVHWMFISLVSEELHQLPAGPLTCLTLKTMWSLYVLKFISIDFIAKYAKYISILSLPFLSLACLL